MSVYGGHSVLSSAINYFFFFCRMTTTTMAAAITQMEPMTRAVELLEVVFTGASEGVLGAVLGAGSSEAAGSSEGAGSSPFSLALSAMLVEPKPTSSSQSAG